MFEKLKKYAVGLVASAFGLIGSAQAALPVAASDAMTAISGNVTDILAAIWPITALSVGGFVLLRLFKKGANRAI